MSLCSLLYCSVMTAYADEQIPEPLTLKYALSKAASIESPELMSYSAQRQMALAEQDLAISSLGIFASINGRLRYVEPSAIVPASETNDSKISLDISKRLYDFGRSDANIEASKRNLASVDALYTDYISRRTVAILQAYFNVLLADIIFNHANEVMAVDYVTLDKERSRFELKQISDIDFLAIDNKYRKTRRERNQALSDQRITRQHLAQLISPGQLSESLDMPDLKNPANFHFAPACCPTGLMHPVRRKIQSSAAPVCGSCRVIRPKSTTGWRHFSPISHPPLSRLNGIRIPVTYPSPRTPTT